jgi:2-keto-4-pentenoate hydratase
MDQHAFPPDGTLDDPAPVAPSTGAAAVADALLRARRERRPVDARPLARSLHDASHAYLAQALVATATGAAAEGFPRHWKSGGPSRSALPTHAALPAAGVWASPADGRHWHGNLRLIEVEIALRLGQAVTPADAAGLAFEAAAPLVDAMCVSIEWVDSRWLQGADAPALLKLADLQSHGALVLGEWQAFGVRDWASQQVEVRIGAQPVIRRQGTHPMGDPLFVLPAWLRHATRHGQTVPGGTVVTTGSWCGMLPAQAGERVSATFEGIGQAELQL